MENTDTNAGREIAPNTGTNATKFFTLVTRRFIITLPRDIVN